MQTQVLSVDEPALREKVVVCGTPATNRKLGRLMHCDEHIPIPIPNGATLVGRPLLR